MVICLALNGRKRTMKNRPKETIGIVGGGIAGLTAAITLQKQNYRVRVFEASNSIHGIGAGMGLASNGIKGYQYLGLAEGIKKISHRLPKFEVKDPAGKTLFQIDTHRIEENYGEGNYSVHRADLHQFLEEKLSLNTLYSGKRLINLNQEEKKIKLTFSDQTKEEFDIVIGADGVNSTVRQLLLPKARPQYAGYWCWRGVVVNEKIASAGSQAYWGAKGRFGITPLTKNRIYWFSCVNTKLNGRESNWKTKELQKNFSNYPQAVQELLEQTPDDSLIIGPIMDINPLDQFLYDRVLLIGDAAHAATPNMGQGACMAVEDIAVLNEELQENNFIKAAKNMQARRIGRTRYIIKNSKRAGGIAQLSNPCLIKIRNFGFRKLPQGLTQFPIRRLYDENFMS